MTDFSFRWGIPELDDGHTPVYNFMLRYYAQVGVTRDEFLCILHLASYRYESPDGKSKPSQERIAKEMGYLHRNSVNRLIQSLKDKGMLEVMGNMGFTCEYNFAPFSRRCLALFLAAHQVVQGGAHARGQVGAQQRVHEEESLKNKNSKKNKEGASAHPALVRFQEVMSIRPPKAWYDRIIAAVGEDVLSLQKWQGVLMQWIGKGYSPRNVEGVLEVFQVGWKKQAAKPKAAKTAKPDYLGGKFGNEIQH